jgi:cysteine desulfurase
VPASPRAYLDCNATEPLRPEARAAVLAALDVLGNASSVHAEGRAARKLIEAARAEIAALVAAPADGVVFTSGATEALALALVPGFRSAGGRPAARLIAGATEHAAVLAGGGFAAQDVALAPVGRDGVVDLAALDALLAADPRPALVALQLANNETGVIQPVAEAARLARAHGGALVCDAVQGPGRLTLDIAALGADALALSGHKLGAPQGVGALVLAPGAALGERRPAGGQEGRRRGGTENLSGIAGFGAAARAVRERWPEEIARLTSLRDWIESEARTISRAAVVVGAGAPRLGNTICLARPGVSAETTVIAFDLAGVAVSAGAACSSGKLGASHVLAAMGLGDDVARSAVRVSLGWATTRGEAERFVEVWREREARRSGPRAA